MASQEERLSTVERKVAALELRRLYDERKAEESTPPVQAFNLKEINENMTILLGIASAQEQNIRDTREDVEAIKERTERMEGRLDRMEGRLDRIEQHTERMEQRLDRLETTTNQHTSLLTQILERLPKSQ